MGEVVARAARIRMGMLGSSICGTRFVFKPLEQHLRACKHAADMAVAAHDAAEANAAAGAAGHAGSPILLLVQSSLLVLHPMLSVRVQVPK